MSKGLLISLFLCTAPFLEAVAPVKDAASLNTAIINANGGGDPNIQFESSFTYNQLLQPLNTDAVLNSTPRTFTIDGLGNTLTAVSGSKRCFFARTSTGTITIKDLTIQNANAKGGNGFLGGGVGLGAGGGLFLNTNSTIILDNVSFINSRAIGGNSTSGEHGGGGGLGGDGGSTSSISGTGGGGFSGNGGINFHSSNAGGGGFNGNGGSTSVNSGGGGGGGGFNGAVLGGAGDGGNGSSNGQGGSGSTGGVGGNFVGQGGG